MDELHQDIDRLFKESALHAARGLAQVLDPTKPIERGNRRLKSARHRKVALSGLVVLAAVMVFLVPLPQLHLFGSGTPTTSPVTAPAGGPVPANFEPRSFSAVDLEEWWLFGSARCSTGFGICPAIVRTLDGGSEFSGIPSPSVATSEVSQLSFANALDGYVFDPELWETSDGGATWAKVPLPGSVVELATADGEAYALTCPNGSASCQSMEFFRSPVGSRKWQHVSMPIALSYGAQFAVSGPNLYLLSGNAPPLVLLYSADRAASFTRRVDPCSPTLGGSVTAAVDGSPTLWAACASGSEAASWRSQNGGKSWTKGQGGFPASVQLAAASISLALAWPGAERGRPDALARTTDGGRSFSVEVFGSSRVSWVGFDYPTRAYALLTSGSRTRLLESNNGGAGWREVVVKGK